MKRRALRAVAVCLLLVTALAPISLNAATPTGGTLDSVGDVVTWNGPGYNGPADSRSATLGTPIDWCPPEPICDEFDLTVDLPMGSAVQVSITTPDPIQFTIPLTGDDYDLYVYGPLGLPVDEVGRSTTANPTETVVFEHNSPTPVTYLVRVLPYLINNDPSNYSGTAAALLSAPQTDPEVDCLEETPAAFSLDNGQRITINVLVLIDDAPGGIVLDQAFAANVFNTANIPYTGDATIFNEGLNAVFKPIFREVDFGTVTDAPTLIQMAKNLMRGGIRPRRASMYVDIVYVITDKDIAAAPIGQPVAGLADCIGGVRYDQHAFAVGEAHADPISFGPSPPLPVFYTNFGAKVAAHEIGHLFGAHHHYMNCVETARPPEAPDYGGDRCTLMTNFVDFTGLEFSSLNRAVVRGHAVTWAAP